MSYIRKYFEISMLLIFGLIWLYMIYVKGLPLVIPDISSMIFVGKHYLSPLLYALVIQFFVITFWKRKRDSVWIPYLYIPLILCTVLLHFNFKSWTPLVNATLYDPIYMNIDYYLSSIVQWSQVMILELPFYSPEYLYYKVFIIMFIVSFVVHLTFDSMQNFRKVVVGFCLILLIGGISYWLFPAIGPFVYQDYTTGFTPVQHRMYTLYSYVCDNRLIPPGYFTSALAAMPSLHVAHSFFLTFMAIRSVKILGFLYVPLFVYIFIAAIASRWHYIIDLPFGILLSITVIWLVNRIYSDSQHVNNPDLSRISVK